MMEHGGNGSAAHRGSSGAAGEAGETRGPAKRRRGSPAPEVGNGDVSEASERPTLRSSARRSRTTRRSKWTGRGREGEAVDTTMTSGGDRGARVCSGGGAEEGEELEGECERPGGSRGVGRGEGEAGGGKQELAQLGYALSMQLPRLLAEG